MTNRSWVFHHISATQIECMWRVDVESGYYDLGASGRDFRATKLIREGMPDVCECVPRRADGLS